jgi:citrate synthase
MMTKTQPNRPRNIGTYVQSGDWKGYWSTAISQCSNGGILVYGYPIEEIIEHLSATEAQFLLIRGDLPSAKEAALFDLILRSSGDQEFINAATCAARYVASACPETPVAAVAAGVLASGSVTGSSREAVEMIYAAEAQQQEQGWSPQETARHVVDAYISTNRRLPGIGHPVHQVEPRAEAVRRVAQRHGGWGKRAQLFEAIHAAFVERTGRHLPINLAGMSACVYAELDFTPLQVGALAATGYSFALVAHVVEEISAGVPLRIIPEALGAQYVGPAERSLPEAYCHRRESRHT